MQTRYGVVWRSGGHPLGSGKLEFLPRNLRLVGLSGRVPSTCEVAYDEIAVVRRGCPDEIGLNAEPGLVLELRSGDELRIASAAERSVIAEIAERMADVRSSTQRTHVAVVLPLAEGSEKEARALLEAGPPFDPSTPGLDAHQVYLTQSEVVIVFETGKGSDSIDELLLDPDLWMSAAAWRPHLAGPPRLAETVYSWRGDIAYGRTDMPPRVVEAGAAGFDF